MEWLVIILVLGLICGGLAANIASSKGHDGVAWFFAGLFFGIFGLIAAVGLSNKLTKNAQQAGQLKKCPMCAESVLAEAKVCRFCRYEFPIPPQESPEEKANRLAEEKSKREAAERTRAIAQKRANKMVLVIVGITVISPIAFWIITYDPEKVSVGTTKQSKSLYPSERDTVAGDEDLTSRAERLEAKPSPKSPSKSQKPRHETYAVPRHLITLRYPSGSQPTFIIDEMYAEEQWKKLSIGDSVSPRNLSRTGDTWVLVSPQMLGSDAPLGVIIQKIDTLVMVEE